MRTRILATVAVATWSKTALAPAAHGAAVAPTAATTGTSADATTPPSTCPSGPVYVGAPVQLSGTTVTSQAVTHFKGDAICGPGTLTLRASRDQQQWKTLSSAHTSEELGGATLQSACGSGTWWYEARYVSDDLSFKGSSTAVSFTC